MRQRLAHILAVDMGGTNSRFGHFILEDGVLRLVAHEQCSTASLEHTEDALRAAARTGLDPLAAHVHVWALACGKLEHPLQAHFTNADLDLDFRTFGSEEQRKRLHLINDFAAQAWACMGLPGDEAAVILPACSRGGSSRGVRAVLGAGTGLGTASILTLHQGRHVVLPAEGGHVDFAFVGEEELAYAAFLRHQYGTSRISAEHVLSGRGLALLHQGLTAEDWPVERVAAHLVDAQGHENRTATLFARFLGRFCRQWAMNTLCSGGLYVGGGVAVKNPCLVHSPSFKEEFLNGPEHLCNFLREMPVYLLRHPLTGLWGAARAAQSILE